MVVFKRAEGTHSHLYFWSLLDLDQLSRSAVFKKAESSPDEGNRDSLEDADIGSFANVRKLLTVPSCMPRKKN